MGWAKEVFLSPTVAELVVGIIAAVLVFMVAARVIPILVRQVAEYFNRTLDEDYGKKDTDHYES